MNESIGCFILGIFFGALISLICFDFFKAKKLQDKIKKAEKENEICRKNRLVNLLNEIHSRTIRIDSALKEIEIYQESNICKKKKR